jgi:hypothetical protein
MLPGTATVVWLRNLTVLLDGGVGLVPKRGCLLTLAYYAFPRWYEFGERRWNDRLTGENRRTRRKTCPSATLSTTNPTWIDPGANPALRGERPAINDLSHGMAQVWLLMWSGLRLCTISALATVFFLLHDSSWFISFNRTMCWNFKRRVFLFLTFNPESLQNFFFFFLFCS